MTFDINELYLAARDGNEAEEKQLFERLLESFGLFVRRKVQDRHDGEEIVQDALSVIARQYMEIEIEISFSGWAYRILTNKLNDHYRRKHRAGLNDNRYEGAEIEGVSTDLDADLRRQLESCIGKVSRVKINYARVLNLTYRGYSTEDICSRIGLSRNAVYVALSRARRMLRKCLEQEGLE